MAESVLFTTSQVSEMLQVDSSTVRKWVAKGLLKAIALPGGHYRFDPADIEALKSAPSSIEASA